MFVDFLFLSGGYFIEYGAHSRMVDVVAADEVFTER